MLADDFKIRFIARHEVLEYVDAGGSYKFDFSKQDNHAPDPVTARAAAIASAKAAGAKVVDFSIKWRAKNEVLEYFESVTGGIHRFKVHEARYPLSADERARILPRISAYLSHMKYFGGFLSKSYTVRFVEEP